jgi:hypothetical protein
VNETFAGNFQRCLRVADRGELTCAVVSLLAKALLNIE